MSNNLISYLQYTRWRLQCSIKFIWADREKALESANSLHVKVGYLLCDRYVNGLPYVWRA